MLSKKSPLEFPFGEFRFADLNVDRVPMVLQVD